MIVWNVLEDRDRWEKALRTESGQNVSPEGSAPTSASVVRKLPAGPQQSHPRPRVVGPAFTIASRPQQRPRESVWSPQPRALAPGEGFQGQNGEDSSLGEGQPRKRRDPHTHLHPQVPSEVRKQSFFMLPIKPDYSSLQQNVPKKQASGRAGREVAPGSADGGQGGLARGLCLSRCRYRPSHRAHSPLTFPGEQVRADRGGTGESLKRSG